MINPSEWLWDTPVRKVLATRFPLVQAGMIWASGADLAIAVAKAGGLGLIGAGSMRPDLLQQQIRKATSAIGSNGVFGVNLPLFNKYSDDFAEIIISEKVKVVFSSGGSPKKYTRQFKDAGITVAHVVPNVMLAVKSQDAGVDMVVCEGFEAGGHNGKDEIPTFVLIPQVVDAVSIPVLAAGGIADGRGIVAARALGASGYQIGTRFAASLESCSHPRFKEAIVAATDSDTVLTLKEITPVRLKKNCFVSAVEDAYKRNASHEELIELLGTGRARQGIFEGDVDDGEIEIGCIAGMIHDIPSAGSIVERLVHEAEAVLSY